MSTNTTPLLVVTKKIDSTYVTQIAVALCKCYTNPNIYSVELGSMPFVYNFDLATVTGFFVLQLLFHASIVRGDHRIYIKNYLVYIIATEFQYKGIILPPQLDCSKTSRDVWFSECDRIPFLLSMYNNLNESAKTFLRLYLKFDGRTPSAINTEFEPGETLYTPYAGGRELHEYVRLQFWQTVNFSHIHTGNIDLILPYPIREILDWSGGDLKNLIDAFCEMIYQSNSSA